MKRYDYKFVEVTADNRLKSKPGETFEACKSVIFEEAKNGWRLKQIVVPFNEKMGVYGALNYQVIFEKEI